MTSDFASADHESIEALVNARYGDPFALLGPHKTEAGWIIRAMLPDALAVTVIERASNLALGILDKVHPAGLFSGMISVFSPYRFHIETAESTRDTEDPYSFPLLLGELDLHLLSEGRHRDLAACLGSHPMMIDSVQGTRFAVWAPNARRVSVVGDFNRWDGRCHPMRLRHQAGVWEIFIPRVKVGSIYKFEILSSHGSILPLKSDPISFEMENPPRTASVVADIKHFRWTDDEWCRTRMARSTTDAPISIYEVHAKSWPLSLDDRNASWRVLIDRMIPYVVNMGFTHIEFMPIMAHPFGGSWGYQPHGLFAPMPEMGSPNDFARLIDRCHEAGLGVILDWVPAHFPNDAHGLVHFDGTALYEHEDPREGLHQDWNTIIYNLGRNEVRGFLIASALHWVEQYHVDGLRVDAVASMLYRDYSRDAGEWIPNQYGGRENLESISFLRELNEVMNERCPGTTVMAEESTAWPGVTRGTREGGLGFSYKWNMGWMHDTLDYMHEDPVHRRYHHDKIAFGLVYAFSEQFVLPLSHDEVVHGKRSLLGRMPGDEWQRFANLRAYFGLMWAHPGKKLLFMGGEFGQEQEWNHDSGLDWMLLDKPRHRGLQVLVRDLNTVYKHNPALYRQDCCPSGFSWIVLDDRDQSVFAWFRFGNADDSPVLAVCNLTPIPRYSYRIGVPRNGYWRELLNTDALEYSGSGMGNAGGVRAEFVPSHGHDCSLSLTLPPLATLLLHAPVGE